MSFLTDRKRAVGMGSAKSGVHHFWAMKMSSVALLILVPLFVFTVGPAIGKTHAEVLEYFSRPFPAIIAALTIIVGFKHFHSTQFIELAARTDKFGHDRLARQGAVDELRLTVVPGDAPAIVT